MEQIKSFFKKIKWETLITALFAIAIGIVFIVVPQSSADVICIVLGSVLIALGAFLLALYLFSFISLSHLLLLSILLVTTGILFLTQPAIMKNLFSIVLGLFLIVDGIVKFENGISCASAKVKDSWLLFVMAICSVALGFVVVFGSFDYVMLLCGISLIVDGVFDVVTTIMFSSYIRRTEKQIKNILKQDIIDIE